MGLDLAAGIVRVLRADGTTAGTGFVVSSDGLLVTCAHVVDLVKARPGDRVRVAFHRTGDEATAVVVPESYRSADAQDIAFLRCDAAPPTQVMALPLASSSGLAGRDFETFGFPAVKSRDGLGATGRIGTDTREAGCRVVQLMNTTDLTAGFSGAPVVAHQRVVGMVLSITAPDEYGRLGQTAFMVPSESLRAACPSLAISDACPYRGLAAFAEEHMDDFHGRSQLVGTLSDRLKNDRAFLAVLGPSGSGKSSVVKAGLIPRLRGTAASPGLYGEIVVTRPADWEALDRTQLPGAATDLPAAVRRVLGARSDGKRLVLLVDQFEELFVVVPPEIRANIVAQLALLVASDQACTVIVTMRDDFYGRLSQEATALLPWIERALVNIPPVIERSDLDAIARKPAEAVGLRFEDGLVERILDDAIEAAPGPPGSAAARSTVLPLLEFALEQLWQQRVDGMLTHQSYDRIGGVLGGVTQWANQAYDRLSDAAKPVARSICAQLVHLGDEQLGLPDTRRRRSLTALRGTDDPAPTIDAVIRSMAEARILVTSREADGDVVELIHDLLVRQWALLQSWLRADKRFLKWHQEIESRATAWAAVEPDGSTHDPGRLLPEGNDLAEARRYVESRSTELTAVERDYILTSVATRQEERERLEHLLEETRSQRDEAVRQREITLSRQLAAEAGMLVEDRSHLLQKAVLLAIESLRRAPSMAADRVLRQGIGLLPWFRSGLVTGVPGGAVETDDDGNYVQTAQVGPDGAAAISETLAISPTGKHVNGVSLAFHPDGQFLALTAGMSTLRVQPVGNGPSTSSEMPKVAGSVVYSPTGRYLAVRSLEQDRDQPGFVWIFDAVDQAWVQLSHEKPIATMAFSPDEAYCATAGGDRTIRIWDPGTGREVMRLPSPASYGASAFAFSPDSRSIAYVDKAALIPNDVRLCELPSGNEIASFPQPTGAQIVIMSPDGRYLVTTGGQTAMIWDLASRSLVGQCSHELLISGVAVSPDSGLVATVSLDRTARVWRMPGGEPVGQWLHDGALWGVAFHPGGRYLVTAGESCLVRVWDVRSGAEAARLVLDDETSAANEMAFSADGSLLAVASNQGAFWVYETLPRRTDAWLAHDAPVTAVAFMPDGLTLATTTGGGPRAVQSQCRFWHVESGTVAGQLAGDPSGVVFSANGAYGAMGGYPVPSGEGAAKGTLVWDLKTRAQVSLIRGHACVRGIAFDPAGTHLAMADRASDVHVWDVVTAQESFRITVEGAAIALAYDHATGDLVTASWSSASMATGTLIQVWDPTGKERGRQACAMIARAVAVSPDGASIALAGYGGAQIWRRDSLGQTDAKPAVALPLAGLANDAAFAPDGRHVALAGSDHAASIWDVATAQEIARVDHADVVRAVTFSPDGKWLATASDDESVGLWLWRPDDLIEAVLPRLTRNLTPSEWARHIGPEAPYVCTQPALGPGRDPALIPQRVIVPMMPFVMGRKRQKNAQAQTT